VRDSHSHDSAKITAILAISLDGRISSAKDTAARFSSKADLCHLEQQIALYDGIIFGASTLRAYGTTITIKNAQLLAQRQQRQQSPQPLNIVCSSSGNLDPNYPFFSQPVTRALLTTNHGWRLWQSIKANLSGDQEGFDHIIVSENPDHHTINWQSALTQFQKLKIAKIAVLGGAKLFSSLLAKNLIDDLWLTVCPLMFGNSQAPNLINHHLASPLQLNLLSHKVVDSEVFLHYQVNKNITILNNTY
jgi:riboflavin biosynthesis pyrimidine reductase